MTSAVTVGYDPALFDLTDPEARLQALIESPGAGFQASVIAAARAVVVDALRQKRIENACEREGKTPSHRTRIVVAYTSNLISCGLRETLASLASQRLADAFISTAGGVEEDIIKCLGHTYLGDFALKGADLRTQGLNRVGNLIIPNDNYVNFETFFVPVIERLHAAQLQSSWEEATAPSDAIRVAGEMMDEEFAQSLLNIDGDRAAMSAEALAAALEHTKRHSLVCQCARQKIPIFCPAITDGSMGDMMCFYNFKNKGFVMDPTADYGPLLPRLSTDGAPSDTDVQEHCVVLCLGSGLPRNYALTHTAAATQAPTNPAVRYRRTIVQIVTGNDGDGSRSGAQLREDLHEGLVSPHDRVLRVHGDATIVAPLLMANVFPPTI